MKMICSAHKTCCLRDCEFCKPHKPDGRCQTACIDGAVCGPVLPRNFGKLKMSAKVKAFGKRFEAMKK